MWQVSVGIFILIVKVFIFVSNCRLTNIIHWPCYLIVGQLMLLYCPCYVVILWPCYLIVGQLIFMHPAIYMYMFILSFINVIVRGLFEWKQICGDLFLSFSNICLDVADPIINDTLVIKRINTAIVLCLSHARTRTPKIICHDPFYV